MDYHPRARVPSFANGISASLRSSRGIVWKFQSSLDWVKSVMRNQREMGWRCLRVSLALWRYALPANHLLPRDSELTPSQMFDLLDAAPNSNSIHILRQILHVAAYPPGDARNPAWNVSPDFDHLSWSNLPQELRKVRTPHNRQSSS